MSPSRVHRLHTLWWGAAIVVFLLAATHQLGLPGLHYDEAKEAGVNAMELLTGAPVTAFRDAAIDLFGRRWPLMVQDYIGALNVYLALPFLGLTGIGVPNLRILAVLTGVFSLITLERAVSSWMAYARELADGERSAPSHAVRTPISLAGLFTLTLLAVAPSFVFWSRQGIFVTNLTQPLTFACIWQGIAWLRSGRRRALVWSALAGGLALYAKLLAIWVVGPFVLMAGIWWVWLRSRRRAAPDLDWRSVGMALLAFLLALSPLLLFNLQTGGTGQSLFQNARESYYGVNNLALAANLGVRWEQLLQSLHGGHFWYLGGIYTNPVAVWLGAAALLVGAWRRPGVVLPPLLLLALAFCASLFTISDLFITHYALLHPLVVATIGIGLAASLPRSFSAAGNAAGRAAYFGVALFLASWLFFDLSATLRYHAALNRSGGLADHSDATYHLAYHLQYNGLGAPIALDWGMDAPVRYLSSGTVTPIEIFGYASPAQPDAGFDARLAPFLDNPSNVYLLRAPEQTVFAGRRAAFDAAVAARGAVVQLEAQFNQRDGTPLFELWRVHPQ